MYQYISFINTTGQHFRLLLKVSYAHQHIYFNMLQFKIADQVSHYQENVVKLVVSLSLVSWTPRVYIFLLFYSTTGLKWTLYHSVSDVSTDTMASWVQSRYDIMSQVHSDEVAVIYRGVMWAKSDRRAEENREKHEQPSELSVPLRVRSCFRNWSRDFVF